MADDSWEVPDDGEVYDPERYRVLSALRIVAALLGVGMIAGVIVAIASEEVSFAFLSVLCVVGLVTTRISFGVIKAQHKRAIAFARHEALTGSSPPRASLPVEVVEAVESTSSGAWGVVVNMSILLGLVASAVTLTKGC